MPFSPTPPPAGSSPLPVPGREPPDPHAVRLAALVTIPILLVALIAGHFALPTLLFLAPSLNAQSNGGDSGGAQATFQGFVFPWTQADTTPNPAAIAGYDTPASLKNMRSQADIFHMNAVIIPVTAVMPSSNQATLRSDVGDKLTFPDNVYEQAITDAQLAKLEPIIELRVVVSDCSAQDPLVSSYCAGEQWANYSHSVGITDNNGNHPLTGDLEAQWFDNYTTFAIHYAQIAKRHHLKYFIIGDGLSSLTYDTSSTSAKADPGGVIRRTGDLCPPNPTGRRECEWRHVVNALKQPGYPKLSDGSSQVGAAFNGQLIYAASWSATPGASDSGPNQSEFDHISWWDALSFIGVDANFPLTASTPDASVAALEGAWHGKGQGLAGLGDIYSKLSGLAGQFNRQVLFTGVSYPSVPGANTLDFANGNIPDTADDQSEQLYDIQALLGTFEGQSWWAGVFWYADQPVSPRRLQANWKVSANWAGDTLSASKTAGQWLAQHYRPHPLN